jgi:PAS domain S-box-containing protein
MGNHSFRRAYFDKLNYDEAGMIGVDTVGSRLGTIVNCSPHIKNQLGYEKTTLLGKNITRIMPKMYSDLHNNFILNYLHKKD